MSTTTRPALTDEQRAEREYTRQAVEQLRSSDGWQRWLGTRRHFHSYSLSNQLLIAMTRPTATRVAGFRTWLELGYAVQRGEHAIKIWAPCPPSRKQLERWQHEGAHPDQRPRTYFKLVPVFDRLSRVRSGDVIDARAGRYVACPVPRLRCLSARQRRTGGDGFGMRGRRGAGARRATAQLRSRARLAGTAGSGARAGTPRSQTTGQPHGRHDDRHELIPLSTMRDRRRAQGRHETRGQLTPALEAAPVTRRGRAGRRCSGEQWRLG